ncbi:unnamed protein product, partial [Prorocentrum cordatum]
EDHHGIMAADWAQTLGFQQALRHEEAAREELAAEVAELRDAERARAEEAATLRQDAARWQLLCKPGVAEDADSDEVDSVLEVAIPATARLHREARIRGRTARMQLRDELERPPPCARTGRRPCSSGRASTCASARPVGRGCGPTGAPYAR